MTAIFTSDNIISFFILAILEIILGIDNVIFVSIIINQLKTEKEELKARRIWMITGMISRSILLFGLSWLLQQRGVTWFSLFNKDFDLSSLVMIAGGLFLIYKTVGEIHKKLEGEDPNMIGKKKKQIGFWYAVGQIILIDAVFSFDSIITAGGTAKKLEVMIAAVVIAMTVMFRYSPKISSFIHKHPTIKMLALSFLVMIGLSLVIEGWSPEKAEALHLKNYIYFGMAFSFGVEVLNMVMRKKMNQKVVTLNEPVLEEEQISK